MKAKIKLKNEEYMVDFNLLPLNINSINKEVDSKTKNKLKEVVQNFIIKKYGCAVSEFYVNIKQKFINYINENGSVRIINACDHFNVKSSSNEQRILYRMVYEFEKKGYVEKVHKGKYKLIKNIPNL